MDVVLLREATDVAQLVSATSAGSRYVSVFIGERFNMAARIKADKVSVRFEPVNASGLFLTKDAEALQALGITVNDNGKYASAHFMGLTKSQRLQAVASLLAGVVQLNGSLACKVMAVEMLYVIEGSSV